MFYLYVGMAIFGFLLATWGVLELQRNGITNLMPVPPKRRIKTGPYRFLKHPIYVANAFFIGGLAGMAAGFWNFLAAALIVELISRFWIGLENEND